MGAKTHPESVQIPSKPMGIQPLKRDPEKTFFYYPKSGPGFFALGAKSYPKRHPEIMKKSTPKKYPKIIPKGSKRIENLYNMAPKIMKKPYKNQCRKRMEKTLKKY